MYIKKSYLIGLYCSIVIVIGCSCNIIQATTINLDQSQIYVAPRADKVKQFAATELRDHLKLVTGKAIPLIKNLKALQNNKFTFMVGKPAPQIKKQLKKQRKLAAEAAYYSLSKNDKRLYLWGDDYISSRYTTPRATCAAIRNRTGTLSAVYDFLHNELGVRWIRPGKDGISYRKQHSFNIKNKNYVWQPTMLFSGFRTEAWRPRVINECRAATPKKMRVTAAYLQKQRTKDLIWQRRMKFSSARIPEYQHAFTRYWEKYGKQHPKWFALGKNGKRGVAAGQRADRLKLCVSNSQLLDAIAAQWKAKWLRNKNYNIYNACPNDSQGYCRCKNCCALDVTLAEDKKYAGITGLDPNGIIKKQEKGDTFETDPKSDRYVYFWNELLKRAKRFNPQAQLTVYIYADYRYAPRKQILADGVICGFVPRCLDLPTTTAKEWAKWKKHGMKQVFLRPNDFNDSIGMPMGNSKYIYDKFAVSNAYKLVGSDYDRAYNPLDYNLDGLTFYILAQAHHYPEKNYNELVDEYCSTFGNAKSAVKNYYNYWVKLFEQKRLDHVQQASGFEGRGYLYSHLADFYQPQDFINAENILRQALKKTLTPRVRRIIKSMLLSTEHSRILYQAIVTNQGQADNRLKQQASQALYKFRLKNRNKLSGSLMMLFDNEDSFSDVTGIRRYVIDVPKGRLITLSYKWKFKIDPKNIGLKKHWERLSWRKIVQKWDDIMVNAIWEQQKSYSTAKLGKQLKKYNGIGWYAIKIKHRAQLKGKKVNLLFGAVDESCWIYMNGRLVGKHLFLHPDDWKCRFAIPIDANALATKDQVLIVRVEDKMGAGGIWKPVSLQILE
jgi:hypothetical protein